MSAKVVQHISFRLETHAAVLRALERPVVVVQAQVHIKLGLRAKSFVTIRHLAGKFGLLDL